MAIAAIKNMLTPQPVEVPVYRAFYKRDPKSIDGQFTIQKTTGNKTFKIFERIYSRSGQKGYTSTDWVRAKSPVPRRDLWLWTHSINVGAKPGKTGIGEFFFISSDPQNPLIIVDEKTAKNRSAVGLHAENALPGSAGCIVVVSQRDFDAIARLLHDLNAKGVKRMRLTVFM